jgi:hypothetical protein
VLRYTQMYQEVSLRSSSDRAFLMFTFIVAEHVCSDGNMPAFWQTGTTQSLVYHTIELYAPQPFDERNEQIMSGRVVLAAESVSTTFSYNTRYRSRHPHPQREGLTYKTGGHHLVRESFVKNGSLDDGMDRDFRRIGDNWPVLAFAQSLVLPSNSVEVQTVRFILGHVRDPAISYRPSVVDDVQSLSLLYYAHYGTWQNAVCPCYDS